MQCGFERTSREIKFESCVRNGVCTDRSLRGFLRLLQAVRGFDLSLCDSLSLLTLISVKCGVFLVDTLVMAESMAETLDFLPFAINARSFFIATTLGVELDLRALQGGVARREEG